MHISIKIRLWSAVKFFISCINNAFLISVPHFLCDAEFWKQVPPSEPYRVVLGDVRDKLYHTRERTRQLLSHGYSDIPEEATFTSVEQVIIVFHFYCCSPVAKH